MSTFLRLVLAGFVTCWSALVLAQTQSLPASIPLKRDAPDNHATSVAMLFILGLIAVALIAFGYAWRRRQRHGALLPNSLPNRLAARWWPNWMTTDARHGSLKIIHSTRLNTRVTLYDLRWQQQNLLLACSDAQVTVLARCSTPAEHADQVQENVA